MPKWLPSKAKIQIHHESLTVPKEVLSPSEGYFCLVVRTVYYLQKDESYCLYDGGYVIARYDYLEEDTVRLSKPKSSVVT